MGETVSPTRARGVRESSPDAVLCALAPVNAQVFTLRKPLCSSRLHRF